MTLTKIVPEWQKREGGGLDAEAIILILGFLFPQKERSLGNEDR